VLGTLNPQKWADVKSLPSYDKIKDMKQHERRLRQKFNRPATMESLQHQGFDLLSKMLEYDPAQRITAAAALDHPYFQEIPLPVSNSLNFVTLSLHSNAT